MRKHLHCSNEKNNPKYPALPKSTSRRQKIEPSMWRRRAPLSADDIVFETVENSVDTFLSAWQKNGQESAG